MNAVLQRLGTWAARRHWWVIGAWLVVLIGLTTARGLIGGTFVNLPPATVYKISRR